jgi:hypothetical protein
MILTGGAAARFPYHAIPSRVRAPSQHPATYEFRTDKWAELYSKRIDDMITGSREGSNNHVGRVAGDPWRQI